MKWSTIRLLLFVAFIVTARGTLAEQLPSDSDATILAALKARGVRVAKNAVLDLTAHGRIDYVEIAFEKKSWAAATELLATLKPIQQNLALSFTRVPLTDDDLSLLRGCENVMFLTISDCDVTDGGLKSLATLPRLRELSVSDKDLTAAALDAFVDL
ncbi:MAG TPA: hypothetical protein VGN12_29385 [Pirellulales bacterium]|jgi:hypothetical protein